MKEDEQQLGNKETPSQDTELDTEQKRAKKKRNYSQTFNITKEFHKTGNFETVQTYQKGGGTFSLLKFEPMAKLKPTTSNIRIVPKSLDGGTTVQTLTSNGESSPKSSSPNSSQDPTTPGSNNFAIKQDGKIVSLPRNSSTTPPTSNPNTFPSNSTLQDGSSSTCTLPHSSQTNFNVQYYATNTFGKIGLPSQHFVPGQSQIVPQQQSTLYHKSRTGSSNVAVSPNFTPGYSSSPNQQPHSNASSPIYTPPSPLYISSQNITQQQILPPNAAQRSEQTSPNYSSAFKPVLPRSSPEKQTVVQADNSTTKRRKMDLAYILNKE